jgi:hypothetical protein
MHLQVAALTTSYQLLNLAAIHLPVSFPLVAELQQAVAGIVTLPTVRTDQETAPPATFAIEVLRNREAHPTAAR